MSAAEDLQHFLEHEMRMSHVYQPLIIRTLLDNGGTATIRQLAQALLAEDESQLLYYEDRLRKMPLPVLCKHEVIERDGDLVRLRAGSLPFEDRVALRALCETSLSDFLQDRGLSVWDYRRLESAPVSESLRYEILRESGGRCELCGATKDDSRLEVDHIVPRSKGGSNERKNLQVLCDRCNRGKLNRDDTDFRD